MIGTNKLFLAQKIIYNISAGTKEPFWAQKVDEYNRKYVILNFVCRFLRKACYEKTKRIC
jgi:hypothetical protein